MKFRSVALLSGVCLLALASCGFSDCTKGEAKAIVKENQNKELPAYTKAKTVAKIDKLSINGDETTKKYFEETFKESIEDAFGDMEIKQGATKEDVEDLDGNELKGMRLAPGAIDAIDLTGITWQKSGSSVGYVVKTETELSKPIEMKSSIFSGTYFNDLNLPASGVVEQYMKIKSGDTWVEASLKFTTTVTYIK